MIWYFVHQKFFDNDSTNKSVKKCEFDFTDNCTVDLTKYFNIFHQKGIQILG